jgi:hypothetical protein
LCESKRYRLYCRHLSSGFPLILSNPMDASRPTRSGCDLERNAHDPFLATDLEQSCHLVLPGSNSSFIFIFSSIPLCVVLRITMSVTCVPSARISVLSIFIAGCGLPAPPPCPCCEKASAVMVNKPRSDTETIDRNFFIALLHLFFLLNCRLYNRRTAAVFFVWLRCVNPDGNGTLA